MMFIEGLPKAELHVHIEGCLEPQLMMEAAERNGMLECILTQHGWSAKEEAVEQITKRREHYRNLGDFLLLYNTATSVLRKKQDFYDLMTSYIHKAKLNNVRYAEIFFDPQSHLARGVSADDLIFGLTEALEDQAQVPPLDRDFKGKLIASVLRDWKVTEDDERVPLGDFTGLPSAMKALDLLMPYKDKILGLGMSNAELSTLPSVFKNVFKRAKEVGWELVCHCGEEGLPIPYISEALELGITRIDHGVMSLFDDSMIATIVERQIPLTTCPLSNDMLQVISRFFEGENNQLRRLIDKGVKVTVNSDDPAFFKGYLNANYYYVQQHSDLTDEELLQIAVNSFEASFATAQEKSAYIDELCTYAQKHGVALPH